jgi:sugar lactone lactonase YvrE
MKRAPMKRLLWLVLLVGGCRLSDRFHGGSAPDLGAADMTITAGLDLAAADLSQAASGPDLAPPACTGITVSTLTGTGVAGFMDGAGTVAEFNRAEGITVDPTTGNLFIADANNGRVRKVLSDGTTSTFAITNGSNLLVNPLRLVYVAQNLFVVDSAGDGLMEVTSTGAVFREISLGGIQTVAAMADGSLFIGDGQQIYKYGSTPVHYSGTSTPGFLDGASTVAQFGNIGDLAFDSSGKLYVADGGNFRIRVVASDGSVTTLAGSTVGSADGPGATAQFAGPTGLALDDQQHLIYVADGTTIRVVAADGTTSTLVGSTSGFVDGSGCVAKFGALHGIALFAGSLYAVDLNRIRKIVLP